MGLKFQAKLRRLAERRNHALAGGKRRGSAASRRRAAAAASDALDTTASDGGSDRESERDEWSQIRRLPTADSQDEMGDMPLNLFSGVEIGKVAVVEAGTSAAEVARARSAAEFATVFVASSAAAAAAAAASPSPVAPPVDLDTVAGDEAETVASTDTDGNSIISGVTGITGMTGITGLTGFASGGGLGADPDLSLSGLTVQEKNGGSEGCQPGCSEETVEEVKYCALPGACVVSSTAVGVAAMIL